MTEQRMDFDSVGYMIDDDYIDEINAFDWDALDKCPLTETELLEPAYESNVDGSVEYSLSMHLVPLDFSTPVIAMGYTNIYPGDERAEEEIYLECFNALCQGCDDWCD